jgi:hypothetical protein
MEPPDQWDTSTHLTNQALTLPDHLRRGTGHLPDPTAQRVAQRSGLP